MTKIRHFRIPTVEAAGKVTHSKDEQDCYLRHNCTRDVVRRYDGQRRTGGANILRSEEALLRGAARRASAAGRGDRTFAARGALRVVLRLDARSGEWLDHARLGRGDGWCGRGR